MSIINRIRLCIKLVSQVLFRVPAKRLSILELRVDEMIGFWTGEIIFDDIVPPQTINLPEQD